MTSSISQAEAAEQLLWRRDARKDLVSWAKYYLADFQQSPAKHHRLLLEKLQQITDGTLKHSVTGLPCKNLIILMPRGSAKSTYASVIYPPWFIQRRPGCRILACSHSEDLIQKFSRDCRNSVAKHGKVLGYTLSSDSRSVSEWSTSNSASYRCAGVTAGIVGRRGDAGVIDDYIGSHDDADSQLIRESRWQWYQSDFWPCLKPDAIQIIVATRWHEEDLVGCLLDPNNSYNSPVDPSAWEVIRIPYIAEENDPIGRPIGERLWADYYNEAHEKGVRSLPPRIFAGMFQQRPAPEDGDFFKKHMFVPYDRDEYEALMRKNPRIYGAGDWAVSTAKGANRTCFGFAAMDEDGFLYILQDIFWKVADPKEVVTQFVEKLKQRSPMQFWSEKGHISKAWGPFLKEKMLDEGVYTYITEVTPARSKGDRATAIRGRMDMGRVKFPTFAPWWPDAYAEMLSFVGDADNKSDDFVDFLAHLGMGINSISKASPINRTRAPKLGDPMILDYAWLKREERENKRLKTARYEGR